MRTRDSILCKLTVLLSIIAENVENTVFNIHFRNNFIVFLMEHTRFVYDTSDFSSQKFANILSRELADKEDCARV
jgi:hypothetical protein